MIKHLKNEITFYFNTFTLMFRMGFFEKLFFLFFKPYQRVKIIVTPNTYCK